MSVVRVEDQFKFLESQFLEVSKFLKENYSFEIISSSNYNTEFFINSFFNNYAVRSKYLGKKINNYYFVDLSGLDADIGDVDFILLKKLSELIGIEFINLASVLSFLEEQDRFVVIFANSEPSTFSRFLLSYSFILKNHVIYIFSNTQKTELTEKKLDLFFSDAFLNYIVESKIKEMDLEGFDSSKVVNLLNGNLKNLYPAIVGILKVPNEVSFEERPVEHIVQPIIEKEKEEFVNESIEVVNLPPIEQFIQPKIEENIVQKIETAPLPKDFTNMPKLTSREDTVMNVLTDKKFISREEFAHLVWGPEGQSATNDAIDQVISRLRRKFVKAGFPKNYIYSKKGEGVGISE